MRLKRAATMIVCVLLGLASARAQDDRNPRGRDQRGEGRGGRGGVRGRGGVDEGRRGGRGGRVPDARRLLEYDADGNLLVDQPELRTGLKDLQQNAETALLLVLKGIDTDGDSKLGQGESKALGELVRTFSTVRRADRNRDWQLDDDEMAVLWEQLATACQQHNRDLLQRFDKDGDGTLSDAERAEAKEQVGKGGGGRGGKGGPGRGENGRAGDRDEQGSNRRRRDDDRR